MIVEFSFSNFKSYKDLTSLSFQACDNETLSNDVSTIPLKDGTSLRLLNSIVILGKNGSGKSNILYALESLLFMVRNSRNWDVHYYNPFYLPFSLDNFSKLNHIEMRLDFVEGGNRYRYSISYNAIEFLNEELVKIVSGGKELIFSIYRDKEVDCGISVGEEFKNTILEKVFKELLPNQLLLSKLGTFKTNGLEEVNRVLADMHIHTIKDRIDFNENNVQVVEEILTSMDTEAFKQLKRLIRIADVGIDNIFMKCHEQEEFTFPPSVQNHERQHFMQKYKWEILAKHGDYYLPLREESTGVKNLFIIGALVVDTLRKGTTLVIDDMNLAMHPFLLRFIVTLFHNSETNKKNAQLLFTCHDITIMNDRSLRADQIWLTEKDQNGRSELFSLQDFEGIPITSDFGNWYMAGRFGALPRLKDVEAIFKDEA